MSGKEEMKDMEERERQGIDNFTLPLIADSNGLTSQTIKVLLDHNADITPRDKYKRAIFWAADPPADIGCILMQKMEKDGGI